MTPATRHTSNQRWLSRFGRSRILIVGDLMLDEFVWGKVSRISPEAPVPVVWVQSESVMPGGAANVANNIRSLGGQAIVAGIVGDDRWGGVLLEELTARKINTDGVIKVHRLTTVKTRVIAHHQQVVRVDREQKDRLPPRLIEELSRVVHDQLDRVDAVIIEDYGKGTVTRQLLESVIPAARQRRKIITVDPKEEHFDLYHRVTALTPNRAEAGAAVGRELESNADVGRAGKELLRRLECEAILLTLGEDGMRLFERSGRHTNIPTVAQEVFDVAGAGDTVIAVFTLALASGATMVDAARCANHAAGIVVGKVGTGVVTPRELRAQMDSPAFASPASPRLRRGSARGAPRRAPRTATPWVKTRMPEVAGARR